MPAPKFQSRTQQEGEKLLDGGEVALGVAGLIEWADEISRYIDGLERRSGGASTEQPAPSAPPRRPATPKR